MSAATKPPSSVSDAAVASKEEHLMYIAQVLSSYPDTFSGATKTGDDHKSSDPPIPGPVTRELVERAVEYRNLLANLMELQELFGNRELSDLMTEEEREQASSVLSALRARKKELEANPNMRLAQRMLCRLEVWGTKGTSQAMLTYQQSEDAACCPLLNLPVASHFHKFLPVRPAVPDTDQTRDEPSSGKEQSHYPELPLPPNALTWKEYHRLCQMLRPFTTPSQRKELAFSTMAATSKSLMNKTDDWNQDVRSKMTSDTTYTPADFAALWVRAQRHTGALFHMIQLFQVTKKKSGEESATTYLAEYVGNCARVKQIVLAESPKVDRLVEWAVLNQVLHNQAMVEKAVDTGLLPPVRLSSGDEECAAFVTMGDGLPPLMVGDSSASDRHQQTRKRPCDERVFESKKMRRTSTENLLAKAVHSYAIRWLARKHQKVASFLLSPRVRSARARDERQDLFAEIDKLRPTRSLVKARFGGLMGLSDPTDDDCCLGMLDQKMGEEVVDIVAAFDRIHKLLQSLDVALAQSNPVVPLTQKEIEAARNEFKELERCVVRSAGRCEGVCFSAAAARLVDVSKDGESSTLLLESLDIPASWGTECSSCSTQLNDARAVVCCALCEKMIHKECREKLMSPLNPIKVVTGYDPLKKLYKVRLPSDPPKPDFSKEASDIEWTAMQFEMESPTLGVGIQRTGACEDHFNKLHSDSNSDSLAVLEKVMPSTKGQVEPCVLPYEGLLIVRIYPEGMGERLGLRAGDIVVAVKLRNTGQFVDYRDKRRKVMVDLLKQASMLFVQRPSKDIVSMIRLWKEKVVRANSSLCDDIWACKSCHKQVSCDITSCTKRCRSVIRRLSFESFSKPFLGDLMRLDDMMTALMSAEAKDQTLTSAPAFFHPPSRGEENTRQPIEWASGDIRMRPRDLLCEGVRHMLKSATENERDAFLLPFLHLFVMWCMPTTKDNNKLSVTPLWADNLRKFFPIQLCPGCYILQEDGTALCTSSWLGASSLSNWFDVGGL